MEDKQIEDLVQLVINYLYEKITNKKLLTNDDIKLFEIIYKK